jgi:hypothetical protein
MNDIKQANRNMSYQNYQPHQVVVVKQSQKDNDLTQVSKNPYGDRILSLLTTGYAFGLVGVAWAMAFFYFVTSGDFPGRYSSIRIETAERIRFIAESFLVVALLLISLAGWLINKGKGLRMTKSIPYTADR